MIIFNGQEIRTEAEYGKAWRKLAKEEGHRKTVWHGGGRLKKSLKESEYKEMWDKIYPLLQQGYSYTAAGKTINKSKTMVSFLARHYGYNDSRQLKQQHLRIRQARAICEMRKAGRGWKEIAQNQRIAIGTCHSLYEQYAPEFGA